MPMTPAERSLRARLAAHARWSREDPAAQVEKMLAGQEAKFLREVDREAARRGEELSDAERLRRARNRRREHMLRLSLKARKSA